MKSYYFSTIQLALQSTYTSAGHDGGSTHTLAMMIGLEPGLSFSVPGRHLHEGGLRDRSVYSLVPLLNEAILWLLLVAPSVITVVITMLPTHSSEHIHGCMPIFIWHKQLMKFILSFLHEFACCLPKLHLLGFVCFYILICKTIDNHCQYKAQSR